VVNERSFILIRQMTALVRRALAEVCTVPVFLVLRFVDMVATAKASDGRGDLSLCGEHNVTRAKA